MGCAGGGVMGGGEKRRVGVRGEERADAANINRCQDGHDEGCWREGVTGTMVGLSHAVSVSMRVDVKAVGSEGVPSGESRASVNVSVNVSVKAAGREGCQRVRARRRMPNVNVNAA